MGETLPLFKTTFNRAVAVESRPEHLSGEAGAVIQREVMDRLGIIDWMTKRLEDRHGATRILSRRAKRVRRLSAPS